MITYSYDVFDTCLIRICGRAKFVFDILAIRILGEQSELSCRVDFVLERIRAEKKARMMYINSDCEDITLEQIYEVADLNHLTTCDKSVIMEAEMEIEREMLKPVLKVRKEIDEIHASGSNVIFISDMYLSYEFIEEILASNGLYKSGDKLYVSSSVKKSKRTGNLFKLVRDENALDVRNWIHTGDDKINDYKMPRSLGISCRCRRYGFSYYEKLLYNTDTSNIDLDVQKSAFISRTLQLTNEDTPYIKFASDIVAPIFVPYVQHLLDNANRRGIKHLYFVSRDGFILYEIAKVLGNKYPNIDLSYLKVSRKSLYLLTLDDINPESIANLFFDINKVALKDVLDILHMYDFYDKYHDKYRGMHICECIDNLLGEEEFVRELTIRRDTQKTLCSRYFEQMGLYRSNCAIVDLTGSLKCHAAINKVLESTGGQSVFGYYMEALKERITSTSYDSICYEDRYTYNTEVYRFGPHDIMEQYFTATTQDRTSSYKEENGVVKPVYESDNTDKSYKSIVSEANISTCKEYAEYYKLLYLTCTTSKNLVYAALKVYTKFTMAPMAEYLKALAGLEFSKSNVRKEGVLFKSSMINIIANRNKGWFYGNLVYNSQFPNLMTWILKWYTTFRYHNSY